MNSVKLLLLSTIFICFAQSCASSFVRSLPKIIKAIVFDLDGTIADTEGFWFSIFKNRVTKRGISLDKKGEKELHNAMLGKPIKLTAAWMIKRYGLPLDVDAFIDEYHLDAQQNNTGSIAFVPGFVDFFNKIQLYKLKYAIATNCNQFGCDLTNEALNLSRRFGRHIYNIHHVENGKPNPDIYLFAAKQIGVDPSCCVAIEDSATGIASAQNAGMFCIGLYRGDVQKVEKADLVVDSFAQIPIEEWLNEGRVKYADSFSIRS